MPSQHYRSDQKNSKRMVHTNHCSSGICYLEL